MKKLIPFTLLIALFAVSCNLQKESNDIVVNRIQYDVPISNENPVIDWWVNNMEGSKREKFLKDLFEKAGTGKLDAYDYFFEEMSPEEVKGAGTDTIYQTLIQTEPPYDEFDTMILEKITYRDITRIRFLEEWVIDEKTMDISKEVIGIAPIYERGYGDEIYNQLMFWVFFDKRYPAALRDE